MYFDSAKLVNGALHPPINFSLRFYDGHLIVFPLLSVLASPSTRSVGTTKFPSALFFTDPLFPLGGVCPFPFSFSLSLVPSYLACLFPELC